MVREPQPAGPRPAAGLLCLVVAAGLPWFAGACGGETSAREIAPGEVVKDDSVRFGVGTRERLGVRPPGPAQTDTSQAASDLGYALPASWTVLPPQQFRDANFRAGDPAVECYVTLLGGDGGGLLANVNRWRGQIGLPEVGAAALADLETVSMLGSEASLVELVGEDKATTGVVCLLPGRAVFVKMNGPPDLVARERERFLDLCKSLSLGG